VSRDLDQLGAAIKIETNHNAAAVAQAHWAIGYYSLTGCRDRRNHWQNDDLLLRYYHRLRIDRDSVDSVAVVHTLLNVGLPKRLGLPWGVA